MKKAAKIWQVVCCFLVPAVTLFWKLPSIGGERYFALGAFARAIGSGDYYGFWLDSTAGPMLMFCHALMLLGSIVYCARGILALFDKEKRWLNIVGRAMAMLAMYTALIPAQSLPEQERAGYFTVVCICVIPLLEYIGFRFLDEWKEQMDSYREIQKREREEKLRRKKALYFPGKYPKELKGLIWENFRSNFRSGGLLIFGGIMCGIYLVVIIGLGQISVPLKYGTGMSTGKILLTMAAEFGWMIMFLCLILMYYTISNYTKTRKENYRAFLVLGIRTRTIYLIFAAEYIMSLLVAYVAGMVGGSALYMLIRYCFRDMTKGIQVPGVFSVEILGIGSAAFLLIVLLATMFNQENILDMGSSTVFYAEKKPEPIPEKVLGSVIFGLLFFDTGRGIFAIRAWTDNPGSYLAILLSMFLLLSAGMLLYMRRQRKKPGAYQKNLLRNKNIYYRFRRNRWNTFIFSAVHFCVFVIVGSSFLATAIAPAPEKLYPYDIVCMGYEQDVEEIQDIAARHHANGRSYPMVRITARYASESMQSAESLTSVLWPQGQNVAISESTYKEMKKELGKKAKDLDLKGKEMHIVYQEDVAMSPKMIETSGSRLAYRMRFGQPLNHYDNTERNDVFPSKKVVSEEKDILTGVFFEGQQENLVVLSDEWFDEVYSEIMEWNSKNMELRMETQDAQWDAYLEEHGKNMTEGQTTLFVWDVPEEEYDSMMEELGFLKEKYPMDTSWDATAGPLYGARSYVGDIEPVRLENQIVSILTIVILLSFGLLQAYIKTESEMEEIIWQDLFLQRVGMKGKERRKLVRSQVQMNFRISIFVAGVISVIMWATMCAVRYYNGMETLAFFGAGFLFLAVYVLIWEGWLYLMEKRILKETERQ